MKSKRLRGLLLVALCVALVSCGAPGGDSGPVKKQIYDDRLIHEVVYETDYTEEGWGEPLHLSYRLPLLRNDAPDARDFNARLKKLEEDAKAGDITYHQVEWERHWNDSLLSLVLCLRGPYEGEVEYRICNYDFSKGQALSNRELLNWAGLAPDEAQQDLRRAAARKFDADSLAISERYGDCFEALLELRAWTISRSNLEIDEVPLFLGDDGVLHGMAEIGTPAGGGSYVTDLALDDGNEVPGTKTITLGNLTAELADHQVTLTLSEDTRPGEGFLHNGNIDTDTPYPVLGLYGEYTDLALGYAGNGGPLLLCLVDRNGQLSACNVTAAAASGDAFCITGPLTEPYQVIGFEPINDMDACGLLARLSNGETMSVSGVVSRAAATIPSSVRDSSWLTADGGHSLKIRSSESGMTEAVWGDGSGILSSGTLFYDGMTEDGIRFRGSLERESGDIADLLFTVSTHTDAETPEAYSTLTVRQLGGDILPGIPKDSSGTELFRNWETPTM